MKAIYEFSVSTEREVTETTTRVEGDKTIEEKIKVKRKVDIPVMFKRPSRSEREEGDTYQSKWWNTYVNNGIMPTAILLKTYANYDGILNKEQRKEWTELQAALFMAQRALERAELEKASDTRIQELALEFTKARQALLDFQQEQSSFFDNTAESKARKKYIEWLIVNLSYCKPESEGEWVPLFPGETLEEKIASEEKALEEGDELVTKSYEMLALLATALASAEGNISKADLEAFAASLKE